MQKKISNSMFAESCCTCFDRQILWLLPLLLFWDCASVNTKHSVSTNQQAPPEMRITKILVIAMVGDTASLIPRSIEDKFVTALNSIGYEAVSYLDAFGSGGLANTSPEIAFQKLCDQDIDGILPVVLADKAKENKIQLRNKNDYQGLYYFERIWNYRKLQATNEDEFITSPNKRFYWEAVLYSLHTLRPKYVAQLRRSSYDSSANIAEQLSQVIIKDMLRHKVLVKKPVIVKQSHKP